jgi:hypothetical protein
MPFGTVTYLFADIPLLLLSENIQHTSQFLRNANGIIGDCGAVEKPPIIVRTETGCAILAAFTASDALFTASHAATAGFIPAER